VAHFCFRYDYANLIVFLRGSNHYPLEKALKECEASSTPQYP
jgi:hypothetical protein